MKAIRVAVVAVAVLVAVLLGHGQDSALAQTDTDGDTITDALDACVEDPEDLDACTAPAW